MTVKLQWTGWSKVVFLSSSIELDLEIHSKCTWSIVYSSLSVKRQSGTCLRKKSKCEQRTWIYHCLREPIVFHEKHQQSFELHLYLHLQVTSNAPLLFPFLSLLWFGVNLISMSHPVVCGDEISSARCSRRVALAFGAISDSQVNDLFLWMWSVVDYCLTTGDWLTPMEDVRCTGNRDGTDCGLTAMDMEV